MEKREPRLSSRALSEQAQRNKDKKHLPPGAQEFFNARGDQKNPHQTRYTSEVNVYGKLTPLHEVDVWTRRRMGIKY